MSIDLSQFHQIFFEESFEGLDVMEQELLSWRDDAGDAEQINRIFRAAHSIKGGAGTFGFTAVAGFTHVAETLLDEIRSGVRLMQPAYLELLLQSVDCLRAMLQALQAGDIPDTHLSQTLQQQFTAILASSAQPQQDTAVSVSDTSSTAGGWRVQFNPPADLLQTGNEPFRMFRELQEIAGPDAVVIMPDCQSIPDLAALEAERMYLRWTLEVRADISREQIAAVFEWVADECDIRYEPLQAGPVSAGSQSSEQQEPEPVAAAVAATPPAPSATAARQAEPSSIRVSIDKVDSLINLVGELVITQSMLGQLGQHFDMSRLARLQEGLAQLEQNTRELQESVMKIRMMPISFAFSRFPRLVRDLGAQLGKQVHLVLAGETTELDKTVMEKIGDPLVHLVRNSLDHGLEAPAQRRAAGKPEQGVITLSASHQGGYVVIEVRDDGAGLNEEKILAKARSKHLVDDSVPMTAADIHQLIFLPGFSTADTVSDVSGRGVGMDVVKRNIHELNGSIEVQSVAGQGSAFIIRLPLTLAILDGQLVRVGEEIYIIPLVAIVESVQLSKCSVNQIAGNRPVMKLRDEFIPLLWLEQQFGLSPAAQHNGNSMLVVVESESGKLALVVDELLGQQQVVIKSLEQNYEPVAGISGATILGDGTVALIIDVSGLGRTEPARTTAGAAA